jgi:hypothetical protein
MAIRSGRADHNSKAIAPTRIAAARQPSEIDKVISSVEAWRSRYCAAGSRISRTKTMTTRAPTLPSHLLHSGRSELTNVVRRICPSRRSATTVPSIASQRNRRSARSSVHNRGYRLRDHRRVAAKHAVGVEREFEPAAAFLLDFLHRLANPDRHRMVVRHRAPPCRRRCRPAPSGATTSSTPPPEAPDGYGQIVPLQGAGRRQGVSSCGAGVAPRNAKLGRTSPKQQPPLPVVEVQQTAIDAEGQT